MLRKLLITSLVFAALFTVSCEKVKEAAGEITGSVTGIESTYAGTWNAATEDFNNSIFFGSKMIIDEKGGMTYQDTKGNKQLIFDSIAIVKLGDSYTATYNEKNAANPDINDTYTLIIKFTSESQATINYSKKIGNITTKEDNGIFNKQAQ